MSGCDLKCELQIEGIKGKNGSKNKSHHKKVAFVDPLQYFLKFRHRHNSVFVMNKPLQVGRLGAKEQGEEAYTVQSSTRKKIMSQTRTEQIDRAIRTPNMFYSAHFYQGPATRLNGFFGTSSA